MSGYDGFHGAQEISKGLHALAAAQNNANLIAMARFIVEIDGTIGASEAIEQATKILLK